MAITQAGSAGFKAGSAYKAAEAQKMSLRANSWLDSENAKMAEMQAAAAVMDGNRNEQSIELKGADLYSRERSGIAANGIDLGQGSATDVLASTAFLAKRDELTAMDNALRTAWGFQVDARNYRNKSALERAGANQISPFMAAVGSALGSAGSYQGSGGGGGGYSSGDYASAGVSVNAGSYNGIGTDYGG